MSRLLILITALLTSDVLKADELDCLTQILHSEAQGEPLTGIIAVAEASKNRGKNWCSMRGVSRKAVPDNLKPYYRAIAANVVANNTNHQARGADSWERSLKPNGHITRRIAKHTFYRRKEHG